jgi:hypothetical protein
VTAAFTSIHVEGGLLSEDTLARLSALDRDVPGLRPEDFHLAPGERLAEAASRAWARLSAAWRAFRAELERAPKGEPQTTLTREKFLLPLFQELGYGRLVAARAQDIDGRSYAISHGWGQVPIHLLGAGVSLDDRTEKVAGAARMSPHGLVQDFLNRSDPHRWGFVSNGLLLRLLRDHQSLTRQAFIQVDLESLFDGERFADFALLYLLAHQSRFEGDSPDATWLEKWFLLSRESGVRALDDLRAGVERALRALGQGFHRRNESLRKELAEGTYETTEYYRELLRLVYRLIFVFSAEDRLVEGRPALLDPAAPAEAVERYLRYYSTRRLRQLAGAMRGSPHMDLWQGLRPVLAGLHDGCPPLALPALGSFLFGPVATRKLSGLELANSDLLAAVHALAYLERGGARNAIAWRAVAADELGSIYESLLELHLVIEPGGGVELVTAAGHERKKTGSYYTPTSLVDCLLDSALEPVLDEAIKGKDKAGQERALLDLKVCDPACGSGHFLVAAARRIARRLARIRTGDDEPSPRHLQTALRDVVGRCLYGVDISDMAVELCKVALWMEALEPGKPLSFLDAHIQQGNSLLGATPALLSRGIPDDAFTALEGDDKAVAKNLKKRNREARKNAQQSFFAQLADAAASLSDSALAAGCLKADTLADIRDCELRWQELVSSKDYQDARFLADLWCAAFVWPATSDLEELAPTHDLFLRAARDIATVPKKYRREVNRLAAQYAFFHWHLAFPQVFTPDLQPADDDPCGWSGGFDAVLGNPPWGQKQTYADELPWPMVDLRHPSASGIREYCRPFIDLATRIARQDAVVCMVLPDIILLKDYEATRRLLLDQRLDRIDWWGMVFEGTIDACSILWTRCQAEAEHDVRVVVHDPARHADHWIGQQTFAGLERSCFNLFLTEEKAQFLRAFSSLPLLDQFFEVHEGVHSGNIRKELFVGRKVDSTCRPLVFGGEELRPYSIEWRGKYIRLGAVPERRTKQRYANVGKDEWFRSPKVVVRRTGDSIQAAVDPAGRYVSNNFFVVVPTAQAAISLDGLCAVLNSSLITDYFRTVEPREGRAFAEVKIKHLVRIPLPASVATGGTSISRLNSLGAKRREAGRDATDATVKLDDEIERAVIEAFSGTTDLARSVLGARLPARRAGKVAAQGVEERQAR